MIDKKKLIERLEEEQKDAVDKWDGGASHMAYSKTIQIVKDLASEYNDGWIPCEKDLPPQPEENPNFENKPLELYLVSVKNMDFSFRAFWNGEVFTDGWGKLDVIAWQPLPKPYREKGEKE